MTLILLIAAVAAFALIIGLMLMQRRQAPNPAIDGGRGSAPAPKRIESGAQGRRGGTAIGAGPLAGVRSWGYQLQKLDIAKAAASPFDLVVIDYARDGSDETALKPKDLERMRQRSDGPPRKILAYLSIGEAESYRYYWDKRWKREKPAWLLGENPDWDENFAVCFWDEDWQRLMCGAPQAYLDRILAAGFDGVYLDKCDVYEDIRQRHRKAAAGRPDLEADMAAFIARISSHAKGKRPGFAIVMQNAEQLLERADVMAAIDGVAKEELWFGQEGGERRNAAEDAQDAKRCLDLAKRAGKAVLVVEYLDDLKKAAEAAERAREAGFVLHIARKDRELDRLNYVTLEA